MKNIIITLLVFFLSITVVAQEAVLSRNSNLRSGPSSSSNALGSLPTGTAVTVISKYPRSGYVKVKTTDGNQSGWILKRNVTEAEAEETQPRRPDHRSEE